MKAGCGPPATRAAAGGEGPRRLLDLRLTTATFAHGTGLKLAFVALGAVDLLVTLYALSSGYVEVNPVFEAARGLPAGLFLLKVAGPVALAWLVPSKLLLPSIALLAVVLAWNMGALLRPS